MDIVAKLVTPKLNDTRIEDHMKLQALLTVLTIFVTSTAATAMSLGQSQGMEHSQDSLHPQVHASSRCHYGTTPPGSKKWWHRSGGEAGIYVACNPGVRPSSGKLTIKPRNKAKFQRRMQKLSQ